MYLIIILLLSAVSAFSRAQEVCTDSYLATRTGSPSCWVKYDITKDRSSLCIKKEEWFRYLSSNSYHKPGCLELKGKWSAYSKFIENDGLHSNRKQIYLSFKPETWAIKTPAVRGAELFSLFKSIERLRENASRLLGHQDRYGVIRKLVINESTPSSDLGMLRLFGFVHLYTASGMHLYLLYECVAWIVRRVGGGQASAGRLVGLSRCIAAIVWIFVWVLSGARPGLLRPWLIVSCKSISQTLGVRWRPGAPLFCALFIDLSVGLWKAAGSDVSVFQWAPGRIHYALAVGGGFLFIQFYESFMKDDLAYSTDSSARRHFALAIGSWLFVAVWDLFELRMLSLATPLLNIVSFPLITLFVYPVGWLSVLLDLLGFSDAAVFTADIVGIWCSTCLDWLVRGLSTLPNLWVISWRGALLAAFFALFACTIRWRWVCSYLVPLLLIVRFSSGWISWTDGNQVEQLDVGQGDAAIVYGRDSVGFSVGFPVGFSVGLIDVGSEKAFSLSSWLTLLARRGITHVNWIGFTHLDEDHSGGLKKLSQLIPIDCVRVSHAELSSSRGQEWRAQFGSLDIQSFELQQKSCVPFPVRNPDLGRVAWNGAGRRTSSGNSNMTAYWIPLSDGRYYFSMGDADMAQEREFVRWARGFRVPKHSVILKVSHHGSRYSSDVDVLREIFPQEAWISSGVGNRHGHPTIEAIQRLQGLGIAIRRTDEEGSLRSSRAN